MGRLSPIDGIGPAQLGINSLIEKVRTKSVKEVILACNYCRRRRNSILHSGAIEFEDIKVTRIAHGIPVEN